MKKKLFICSDVHGHFTEWKTALDEAGFDKNNKKHLCVHIGDLFDRGEESLECYLFARELENLGTGVFIRGNHDEFIEAFLEKRRSLFNWQYNGLSKTIDSFDHRTQSFAMWCFEKDEKRGDVYSTDYESWAFYTADSINKEYPDLLPWLKGLPYFYETKHNIFTHGGLDMRTPDWKQPTLYYRNMSGWRACTWVGPDFFVGWWNRTGKTCNFGHLNADLLRQYLHKDEENIGEDSIFYWKKENTYFIDACTVLTKRVNVRVTEDELIEVV